MPTAFDPYHRWLSIPPEEQPPTYYRLLGLRPFESDVTAIESAAERQILHVRRYRDTPLGAFSLNLLRELDVARRCLLDAEAKAAYDHWLRHWEADGKQTPHVASSPHSGVSRPKGGPRGSGEAAVSAIPGGQARPASRPVRNDIDRVENEPTAVSPISVPITTTTSRYRKRKRRFRWLPRLVSQVLGAMVGLSAGYLILCTIDPTYDFLNLMPIERVEPKAELKHDQGDGFDIEARPTPRPRAPRGQNNRVERRWPLEGERRPILYEEVQEPRDLEIPIDALADFPRQVALPPLADIGEWKTIGAVPLDLLIDNFELTLLTEAIGSEQRLALVRLPQHEEPSEWTWIVRWEPAAVGSEDGAFARALHIATLSVIDDELRFAWNFEVVDQGASALRNSVLKVHADQQDRFLALRAPLISPELEVNLNARVNRAVCRCEDLPDLSDIRVDLLELVGFPPHTVKGPELTGLKIGDETSLWYDAAGTAATKITISRISSRPAIELESRYRLPSGREDLMRMDRINRALSDLRRRMARGNDRQLRADMNALERIAGIASNLHQEAKVRFRFYIVVDDVEVDLAVNW